MDALRESDERELSALSKQVNALQERLNSAKQEQARLHSADQEKGLHALTDVSTQLVDVGREPEEGLAFGATQARASSTRTRLRPQRAEACETSGWYPDTMPDKL